MSAIHPSATHILYLTGLTRYTEKVWGKVTHFEERLKADIFSFLVQTVLLKLLGNLKMLKRTVAKPFQGTKDFSS